MSESCQTEDVPTSLLDRRLFRLATVDRLLRLTPGTARRWIDGYDRKNRHYAPIVRKKSSGDETVSWGEFVECRLLSEYRDLGVPLQRMRAVVEQLRTEMGVSYPLAHAKPLVHDHDPLLRIQAEEQLDWNLALVVVRNGQLVLSEPAQSFVDAVRWSDQDETGVVTSIVLRPQFEAVKIDPDRGSGEPVIRNTRTEVLAELERSGMSINEIANVYELSTAEVIQAVNFERSFNSAA